MTRLLGSSVVAQAGGWGWLLWVRCPFCCRAWSCFCAGGPALQGPRAERTASTPVSRCTSRRFALQDSAWHKGEQTRGQRPHDGGPTASAARVVGSNVLTFSGGGGRGQTREPKPAQPAQLGAAGRPGRASSARGRLVAGRCCGAARRSTATAAGPRERQPGPGVRGKPAAGAWASPEAQTRALPTRTGRAEQVSSPARPPHMARRPTVTVAESSSWAASKLGLLGSVPPPFTSYPAPTG